MPLRTITLAALLMGLALAALAPAAWATPESTAPLSRATLPTGEIDWNRVGYDCSPCATPYAVQRDALCCSFRDWESCKWQFGVTLGAYIAGMKGTLGLRGAEFDLDNSVGDSLDAFVDYGEAILQGGVAVRKGRWSLEGMFSGMKFKKGAVVQAAGIPIENDLTIKQWQAKLYYRVAETKLNSRPCPWLLVWEPMIGVRGNDIELKVSGPRGAGLSQSKNWVDPVVGCRITWDLRNKWAFAVDGDVGGFGAASDFTWRLRAQAGYRFARWFALTAGWIWIDTDYTDGRGPQQFKWDILQSGPFVALNFAF